jgi:uncharacterized protein (TIGR02996 family)
MRAVDAAKLLAAVAAAPADDAPRLVYADWLTQQGDPRGELISIQCKLAQADEAALAARELELLDAHRDAWAAELGLAGGQVVFRRGFPDQVLVTLDGLKALAARKPKPAVPPARVRVCGRPSHTVITQVLTTCKKLGVTRLDLSGNALGTAGPWKMSEHAALANLTELAMAGCGLGAIGVRHLFRSAHTQRLAVLNVKRNARRDLAEVLAAAKAPALVELDVGVNNLRSGVVALTSSELRLQVLRLRRNDIAAADFGKLVASPWFASVRVLDVRDNLMSAALGEMILASPHTAALTELDVAGCNMPLPDARALLAARPTLVLHARPAAAAELRPEFGDRVRAA